MLKDGMPGSVESGAGDIDASPTGEVEGSTQHADLTEDAPIANVADRKLDLSMQIRLEMNLQPKLTQ